MQTQLHSLWTTAGGLRLHARIARRAESGDGAPLILVHGLGISSLYMVPLARRLAPYYDVYAPDLPGFGRSQKPGHALNIAELAEALLRWMDAAGLQHAHMLGNSMGCQVIVDLALRAPERVRSAVFVGPTADPAARTSLAQAGRAAVDAFREPPSLLLLCAYDYLRAGVLRFVRTLQSLVQDPMLDELPRMAAPTLVIRGARDPIVPSVWAETAASLLPHATYAEVSGAAHAAHYSAPDAVARLVHAFIDRQKTRSAARLRA